MEIFKLIIALIKSGLPLPDLKNAASIEVWIIENADEVAAIVAYFTAKTDITEVQDELAEAIAMLTPEYLAQVKEDGVDLSKWGDGEFMKRLVELFIQLAPFILPFFLEPEPTPDSDVI